jgi:hypothetical protein
MITELEVRALNGLEEPLKKSDEVCMMSIKYKFPYLDAV